MPKLEQERGEYKGQTTNKGIQQRLVDKLFRYWEGHGAPKVVREQLLDLLQQQHGGISGFYRRLRYEFPDFEQQTGISHELLIHREQANMVPSYHEVVSVVGKLFSGSNQVGRALRALRQSQARIAWTESKTAQLTEQRGLEPPLVSLLITLEVYLAEHMGCHFSGATLQEHFGATTPFRVSQLNTNRLITGRTIEWDAIAAVAEQVLAPDQYEAVQEGWEQTMAADAARPSFAKEFFRCKNARGIAMRDLADALGIRAPEERGKGCKPDRVQRYRRSSGIRHAVVEGSGFFDQVSIRALIALVAEDERDDLETLFRDERRRFYQRSGSTLTGDRLELTIARELNGTTPEQIAEEHLSNKRHTASDTRSLAQRIRRIEWGYVREDQLHPGELESLHYAIDTIGSRRSAEAIARRPQKGVELLSSAEFTTIPEAVKTLFQAGGGLVPLHRLLRDSTNDPRYRLGTNRLRGMRHSTCCPPLPILEHMLHTMGVELSEDVRRDWYAQFPPSLLQRKQFPLTRPLSRLLVTLIHAHHVDLPEFCEERLPGISESTVRRTINLIQKGEKTDWRYVAQILTAAEVGEDSILWRLAELLAEGKSARAAVRALRRRLAKEKLDLHPANLPGLTWREIGVKPPVHSPPSSPA